MNSIKPKTATTPNKYEEIPEPDNSITFQPSTKYSLFGPSYENIPETGGGDPKVNEEEGIYEVLDRVEEKPLTKRGNTATDRGVTISGGKTESYNKLEF